MLVPMRFWVSESGGLVDAADARVSVLDHGFTVADGVFETLKVTEGRAFALTRHLERLGRSALAMGLPSPDPVIVRSAVEQTIDANAAHLSGLARLRITYTAGVAPLGSDRGESGTTLVVAISSMSEWPDSTAVVTVAWPRNERGALAGIKSTSYADNVLALAHAHRRGAGEALMPDTRGRLCEGTGSNVFLVLKGQLVTPSLATGCLPGVTRALVLEWSGAVELDYPIEVLGVAEEIFLTSSTRDIQPVHRVNESALPSPGPTTAAVMAEFAQRASNDIDP